MYNKQPKQECRRQSDCRCRDKQGSLNHECSMSHWVHQMFAGLMLLMFSAVVTTVLLITWATRRVLFICVSGTKPDSSKTGGKKGVKIIQDPHYRRYGCTVDMDFALETFRPHRSVAETPATFCNFNKDQNCPFKCWISVIWELCLCFFLIIYSRC